MALSPFLFFFKGRIGHREWWLYLLLISLAPLWWYFATGARRLHDYDMSAWWLLWVPCAGAVALFVIHGFIAGVQGPNHVGAPYASAEPEADQP